MVTITEKKQSKRTRILDAAFQLFVSKSVHATAIDDVVRLAGVAKGTFYLYFRDKYDLLGQIVAYKSAIILEKAVAQLDGAALTELTLAQKAVMICDSIINQLLLNPDLSVLLNKNFSTCFGLLLKNDNESFARAVDRLVDGFVRAGYEESEAKKTLYVLTDMTGSVCCDALNGNGPFGIEEIRPVLHTMIEKVLS